MALTNQPKPAYVDRCLGMTSSPVLTGPEKASSTFKRGAFLIDDDAGFVTESTSPIDASSVAKRTFGMALHDATGVTSANVEFIWITPNVIIEITLTELTAGTHTLVQADLYAVYPITKATANWYLNADAVSDTGGGIVVGFKDPVGTVDARVYMAVSNLVRGGADAGSGIW